MTKLKLMCALGVVLGAVACGGNDELIKGVERRTETLKPDNFLLSPNPKWCVTTNHSFSITFQVATSGDSTGNALVTAWGSTNRHVGDNYATGTGLCTDGNVVGCPGVNGISYPNLLGTPDYGTTFTTYGGGTAPGYIIKNSDGTITTSVDGFKWERC